MITANDSFETIVAIVEKLERENKELRLELKILQRAYDELYEKRYGPNVKPIYAHT